VPPRQCDAMIGLVSNGASLSDVQRVIGQWLMDPTPRLRKKVNCWAMAARATQVEAFVLARIRRFCMHHIVMRLPE
jgi:hypothetical protein